MGGAGFTPAGVARIAGDVHGPGACGRRLVERPQVLRLVPQPPRRENDGLLRDRLETAWVARVPDGARAPQRPVEAVEIAEHGPGGRDHETRGAQPARDLLAVAVELRRGPLRAHRLAPAQHARMPDTSGGAGQGSAAWAYPFRWTASGRTRAHSSSSHSPEARTSSHGSSIHSSLKSRSTRVSPRVARRCASEVRPIAASVTATPRRASARDSSTEYAHTPPTVSVVIRSDRTASTVPPRSA